MLNEILARLPTIQERALQGDSTAVDCILFYELATEKGQSHAAEVIARARFLTMYPELCDLPETPVVLPVLDDDLPVPDLAPDADTGITT